MRRYDYRHCPYGVYHCDGSVVYFDRWYQPIIRITEPAFPEKGEQVVTVCDPKERIKWTDHTWFYKDGNSPTFDSATRRRLENLMAAIPVMAVEVKRRIAAERKATAEERRYARAY